MNLTEISPELIFMFLPIVIMQFGLVIYCLYKIFNEGVENLNKWGWAAICIFANLVGPILFLTIGRKKG